MSFSHLKIYGCTYILQLRGLVYTVKTKKLHRLPPALEKLKTKVFRPLKARLGAKKVVGGTGLLKGFI